MAKDILYPLRRFHGILHEEKVRLQKRRSLKKQLTADFNKNPPTVFLVMTPEHGNLGDHAIAYAETEMLKKNGINYIEITDAQLREWQYYHLLDVMNGHPILIHGGGYLGTLWFNAEKLLREIIRNCPKSDILCLPNTIFYEDSPTGRKEFEKSKKIYNRHKSLWLYAREKTSYETMHNAYCNVKLVPDMVLSLNKSSEKYERHGCLLCLRSDCEKTRTDEQEQIIRKQASLLFGNNIRDTDMVENDRITVEEREDALERKFAEFAQAELVITDRLHGMIFCAVTGTPCIVIDSKSPKVRGCYEWIRHLDYIKFIDEPSQLSDAYHSIPASEHYYDNRYLQHYYDELIEDIVNMTKA